jgi:hypothetical protein
MVEHMQHTAVRADLVQHLVLAALMQALAH